MRKNRDYLLEEFFLEWTVWIQTFCIKWPWL